MWSSLSFPHCANFFPECISPHLSCRYTLRDSYEISAETKEKVFALARQLNYQPNPQCKRFTWTKNKNDRGSDTGNGE